MDQTNKSEKLPAFMEDDFLAAFGR